MPNEEDNEFQAFVEELQLIADNKFVLGDRLVEVGVTAPNLEAKLSSLAIAQSLLGHARLLYNWSFDLLGYKDKKPEIMNQSGKAFPSVVGISSWVDLIAVSYVFNIAFDVYLGAILEAGRQDVAIRIHKLTKEQQEHMYYSEGWALQLAQDQGAIPRKLLEAVERASDEVGAWLERIERNEYFTSHGFFPINADIAQPFHDRVHTLRNGVTAGA